MSVLKNISLSLGDAVSVLEGESFTKGDGGNKTVQVLAAKSYYAVFPNVFCYLQVVK